MIGVMFVIVFILVLVMALVSFEVITIDYSLLPWSSGTSSSDTPDPDNLDPIGTSDDDDPHTCGLSQNLPCDSSDDGDTSDNDDTSDADDPPYDADDPQPSTQWPDH